MWGPTDDHESCERCTRRSTGRRLLRHRLRLRPRPFRAAHRPPLQGVGPPRRRLVEGPPEEHGVARPSALEAGRTRTRASGRRPSPLTPASEVGVDHRGVRDVRQRSDHQRVDLLGDRGRRHRRGAGRTARTTASRRRSPTAGRSIDDPRGPGRCAHAGEDGRAHLRRRARTAVDPADPRGAAQHHVPGTFFVVGSRWPGIRELVRDDPRRGYEIGLHTFTHPDLPTVSRAGVDPRADRRPSWPSPEPPGELELPGAPAVLVDAVGAGRQPAATVLSELGAAGLRHVAQRHRQPRTGQRPGVDAIVPRRHRRRAHGGAVLLHDARRRPLADRRRAGPAHPAAAGARATVHHGQRRPSGCRPRTGRPARRPPAVGRGPIGLGRGGRRDPDRRDASLDLGRAARRRRARRCCDCCSCGGRRPARRAQRRRPAGPGAARSPSRCRWSCRRYNEQEASRPPCGRWSAATTRVEVIVVDDGSTDGTADIVERLAPARTSGWSGRPTRASRPPSTPASPPPATT